MIKKICAIGCALSYTLVLAASLALTPTLAQTAQAKYDIPEPTSYVNDLAELMPYNTASLERELKTFTERYGHELFVVTISALPPDETIEQLTNRWYNTWGIGSKKYSNGVLMLVVKDPPSRRIEVGKGLEGILPDITAKQIITEEFTPERPDIIAISKAMRRVMEVTKQQEYPHEAKSSFTDTAKRIGGNIMEVIIGIGIFAFVGFILSMLYHGLAVITHLGAYLRHWLTRSVVGLLYGAGVWYIIITGQPKETTAAIIIAVAVAYIEFVMTRWAGEKLPKIKPGSFWDSLMNPARNRYGSGSGSSSGSSGSGGSGSGGGFTRSSGGGRSAGGGASG